MAHTMGRSGWHVCACAAMALLAALACAPLGSTAGNDSRHDTVKGTIMGDEEIHTTLRFTSSGGSQKRLTTVDKTQKETITLTGAVDAEGERVGQYSETLSWQNIEVTDDKESASCNDHSYTYWRKTVAKVIMTGTFAGKAALSFTASDPQGPTFKRRYDANVYYPGDSSIDVREESQTIVSGNPCEKSPTKSPSLVSYSKFFHEVLGLGLFGVGSQAFYHTGPCKESCALTGKVIRMDTDKVPKGGTGTAYTSVQWNLKYTYVEPLAPLTKGTGGSKR